MPRRWTAAGWTLAGAALVAMGAWLVADSAWSPYAVAAFTLFALVTAFFASQLLAPELFSIELDPEGIDARTLLRRVRLPWEAVHLARVAHRLGDPWLILEVHVQGGGDDGGDRTEEVGILLPLGADLAALHEWLDARLGRGARPGPPDASATAAPDHREHA